MKFFSFFVSFILGSLLFSQTALSGHGFAWSDKATFSGTRNLVGQYNYNSSGSSIKVTYKSTGHYFVQFEGLGSYRLHGGHVQVSAYGSGKSYCKVDSWNRFRKMNVTVACYNAAGGRVDSQFTISVRNEGDSEPSFAYSYADEESDSEYTAESKYTKTPGTSVTMKRSSQGEYTAIFKGLSAYLFEGGHVQVTAAGSNNHDCRVKSWHKVGTDLQAHVICSAPGGEKRDTRFLVHVTSQTFHGDDNMRAAYAWGSRPTTGTYTAHNHYSNPTTLIKRSSTGVYTVSFDGVSGYGKSNAQASSYGNDFTHCKVRYWYPQAGGTSVVLNCFDQNGFLKDSKFVVRFIYR